MEIQMKNQVSGKTGIHNKHAVADGRNNMPRGSDHSSLAGWRCLLPCYSDEFPGRNVEGAEVSAATAA